MKAKKLFTLLTILTLGITNVWGELTAHTPGIYEKTTDKGGYGCTLTTVASGANAGTFEVYYFSANSKYGNTTDVYGGGSKQQYRLMCADDDSEYQLINTSSTSAFTNSCDWIEMAYATTGFSKSDYTYSSAFNEFFAIAPNGGNTSNTKTCCIKPKNGDILTLKVSGYVEFAILGADNSSSKYMTITVDGGTPTSWKSNTLSRRSVTLTTEEHTIVVANVGTSANNFYGFSLKLPSCDDANASIIANTSIYVNDELDLEFSSDNTNSVVYDIKKGGSATSDASVTAGVFKATVAGTYVVTATQAKDASDHCAVEESVTITVNSKTPVSSVSISGDATAYIGIAKTLTATADQAVSEYKWEVDGVDQGVDAASFNFLAAAAGTYSIVCKARNSFNDPGEYIASSAHSITVGKLCGELIRATRNGKNIDPVTGVVGGTATKVTQDGGKLGSSGHYWKLVLASGNFMPGDVVTVNVSTAAGQGTLAITTDQAGTDVVATAGGVGVAGNNDLTITEAVGNTIWLSRDGTNNTWNGVVDAIFVTRSCTESDDCSISDVTINSEAITPVGKVYSYEVAAASALTEVAVTYSIHPLATAVPASGFTVAVPTAGDPANTQTITVTAEDGTHSDTYTISVSKATAASDVVTLDALAVTGYTLSPTFDAATLAYTITKDYGTADPTTDKVTYTKSEDAQKVEVNYDGTNHKFVVTVTAEDNTTTQDYEITINEAEAKRGLLTVPFSNGAKGAINAAGLEIRVPYIGASEPTVVLANIEYQSGVSGASASMESDKLRITGADSNYDDYTLTFVQLTPSALTLDEGVTFDAVPSYAFAPYGWDSGKGVKFAKNVEDATPRVSSGNTRIYFAIQACDEVQLTSGSAGARDVKIYVNGVLSSVTKTAASGSAIKLALDNSQANFIAIESNQTGGDGGFTKILVKTLAANTLAYTDGAYTTGDAALDLSTLISTYNSDAAITYAVKTDGGTNASISGNNFTATVAGTAVVTATQAASETVRQASVDFNVVVTAGAAKYIVTYYDDATELGTEEVTEGEHPTATGIVTKKLGFNFLGWSETNGGAVVNLTDITINAAKNLYAKYEAVVCPTSGTIFLLNMNKTVSTAVDVRNSSIDLDEYATISGGSATLANTSNNTRAQVTTTPSIRLSNGGEGYVQVELDCPVLEGDIIRYVNTSSGTIGVRAAHGNATNETVLQGNKTEITTVEVNAALDGLHTIYLDRKGNTSDLTYFEIYRCPVVTGVTLSDLTIRVGAKKTPEMTLAPSADARVNSQAWTITSGDTYITIDAATGEITGVAEGDATVKVVLNDDPSISATATVHVVGSIAQQDVTKSTIWDWKNTGATANIQLSNSTDPKKNEGFVMANAAVNNDANFESDKLYIEGEYVVRDYDKTNPYFQGQNIKFNTTVAGLIQVTFSHTGNDKPARELYINGAGTGVSRTSATHEASGFFEVPAGEVSITAYHVNPADGAGQQYIRISKIEFYALGHSRSVTAGNLGTLCLPNNFIARGVDVYSLVGKEAEHGKIVFADLEPDELLVAGQAYIFQANDATAKFYYAPGDPVDAPLTNSALRGNLGATITFQPNSAEAENVYFVKDHALWSAKETGVNIGQYRAYLQMDAVSELANPSPAPGRRYIMLGTNGTNVATGIDDVQDDVRSTKMLIDGRLFILRGEKIYDATGRLVK